MSDPVSAAKSAREALARALGAIQSDPMLLQQLMAVAEPHFQRDGSFVPGRAIGGCSSLDQWPGRYRRGPSSALASAAATLEFARGADRSRGGRRIARAGSQPDGPRSCSCSRTTSLRATSAAGLRAARTATLRAARAKRAAYAATYVAPAPQAPAQPAYQPPAAPAAAPPQASGARIEAELGAHSNSNFYKGLSGNDVVEHGGLFVATYVIPPIGQPITLHVTMPGGYEFDALAIVRWTRETVDSFAAGSSAQPGFGAQFTQIAPEARQLVYRYVCAQSRAALPRRLVTPKRLTVPA